MAAAHDLIRQALAGNQTTWPRLRGAMHALTTDTSPDTAQVLREVVLFSQPLNLDLTHGTTHAAEPVVILRAMAMQQLAAIDPVAHTDMADHLAESPSEHLAHVGKAHQRR